MKFLILVSLALIGAAAASSVHFLSFTEKFNKVYDTPEEYAYRFGVFQQNLDRIQESRDAHFNATGESGDAVYGITQFADLTPREFKDRFLGYSPLSRPMLGRKVAEPTVADIPTAFDWRQKGAVTPVKNQGSCGSCWAFSAGEEIESMNFMAGNPMQSLSIQQIVSCDKVDGGCQGGDTITAYEYVQKAGGIQLEADYPYTSGGGSTGTCKVNAAKQVVGIKDYSYATPACFDSCNKQDEGVLAQNMVSKGPVSICVKASPWQFYTGGVLSSNCAHGYYDLDHCVQLVGYDQTSTVPYWIIRNSWGTGWGIQGYIHIKMGSNLCGVADEATFVETFTL